MYYLGLRTTALMVDKMDIINFNKVIGKDYKVVLRFLTRLIHPCDTYQHLLCARHPRQSGEQGGHGFIVLQLYISDCKWIYIVNCGRWVKKEIDSSIQKIRSQLLRLEEWENHHGQSSGQGMRTVQREGSHLWSTPQGRRELCQTEWLRGCSEGTWWEMDQEGSRDRPGSHTWRIYDFILSTGIGVGGSLWNVKQASQCSVCSLCGSEWIGGRMRVEAECLRGLFDPGDSGLHSQEVNGFKWENKGWILARDWKWEEGSEGKTAG